MGYIHTHVTKINQYDVPSQMWSLSSDGHWSNEMFICFLATATKGTISFAPDYMGYGLSHDNEDEDENDVGKSYLIRHSYVTSFLPLWVKVSYDLKMETDCSTALGDAAVVQGYSEGGK